MSRSEAEKIYQAWNSRGSRNAVTTSSMKSGSFDEFRKTGFDGVKTAVKALMPKIGTRSAAEQTWKLLEKFKRRHSEIVAHEIMKVLQTDEAIRGMLAQFPASLFPDLSDDAQELAKKLDLKNLVFPRTGKRVKVQKMLGKGGMGGAVYLGEDQCGDKYAVKHFLMDSHEIWGFGGSSPVDQLHRTQTHLTKYLEASLTTTCVDSLTIGRDHFMLLQLGEGKVDYTTLAMADVISVFQDMQSAYDYSKNYMSVDIARDVSVLHLDLHGENLMRFNGRLRLIDFGQALIFCPSQGEDWRRLKIARYDRTNPLLYVQYEEPIQSQQRYYDHHNQTGNWFKYITNWQNSYRTAPEVLVCRGCKRQYPASLKIPECYRCGSTKIETAPLRRSDIESLAKLKGVSPGEIGDNPYANGSVKAVNPQQYGCVVLTAVLIKEVWAATEAGRDLGMGGRAARGIETVEAYSLARKGLHKFKAAAPGVAGVMALLLMWFDEMMRRLFDGETFTAKDAVKFFGGSATAPPSRNRRHSM